jgi:flagellar motility protein MotE (MotC chaperone)
MILNEDLKEEAKESLELSKNLEIQLEILNSERETLLKDIENLKARLESLEIRWAESERLRKELTDALRISEASWKSYREEVEARIRKEKIKGIIIGLEAGMMIGMVVGIARR